jgi:hypothetical protein
MYIDVMPLAPKTNYLAREAAASFRAKHRRMVERMGERPLTVCGEVATTQVRV